MSEPDVGGLLECMDASDETSTSGVSMDIKEARSETQTSNQKFLMMRHLIVQRQCIAVIVVAGVCCGVLQVPGA